MFAYDHRNHLITATTLQRRTAYGYDRMRWRASVAISGVTTRRLMDGQRELGQCDVGRQQDLAAC